MLRAKIFVAIFLTAMLQASASLSAPIKFAISGAVKNSFQYRIGSDSARVEEPFGGIPVGTQLTGVIELDVIGAVPEPPFLPGNETGRWVYRLPDQRWSVRLHIDDETLFDMGYIGPNTLNEDCPGTQSISDDIPRQSPQPVAYLTDMVLLDSGLLCHAYTTAAVPSEIEFLFAQLSFETRSSGPHEPATLVTDLNAFGDLELLQTKAGMTEVYFNFTRQTPWEANDITSTHIFADVTDIRRLNVSEPPIFGLLLSGLAVLFLVGNQACQRARQFR